MNAKKHPAWRFDDLDLTSPNSCIRFLVELVKSTWIGEIGTRQAGCINNSIRTILSYHLDAKKLQEMEEYFEKVKTMVNANETANLTQQDYDRVVESLSPEEQLVLAKAVNKLQASANPKQSIMVDNNGPQ